MDNNEAFEKWYKQHDTLSEYSARVAWQAAKQQSAGEIAIAVEQLNRLIGKYDELKADNERLHQTLFLTIKTGKKFAVHKELSEHQKDAVLGFTIAMEEVINEALSATTSSLVEHDNQVIERCAKVCDEQSNEGECPERAEYCADAIRALKG